MIPAEECWGIPEAYDSRSWLAEILFYIAAVWINGQLFLKPGTAQIT